MLFWQSDAAVELHETINPRVGTNLAAVCAMGCLAGGLISIILGCNLFTSLAAAGAVALLLHAMVMMDDLPVLFIYPLAFILWLGLGMRYINMQQRSSV
ncbi:hypothetical protein BDR05DRAFT_578795 [Suillus weaverae]|nr:hypothetical protein BDR05DRAFT_578795 [Suillus weaverae]